ncbi:MAG: MMPL family transporter [Solirubrobacterales bacterium]|nr:MMPL family transporter [Solirubrobacterales bacterium]
MNSPATPVKKEGALAALSRWIYHHRKLTLLIWLGVVVASALLFIAFKGDWKENYLTPGSDSKAASELIANEFPGNTGEGLDVVWKSSAGASSAETTAQINEVLKRVAAENGVGTPPPISSARISEDGSIGYINVPLTQRSWDFEPTDSKKFVKIAEESSDGTLEVQMIAGFFEPGGTPSGPAFLAALIILLIAFGSIVAAGLPIVTAVIGLAVGSLLTLVLARVVDIPSWAPQVADLLAIGVGIDYALLVLTRFRDSLDISGDVEESLVEAVATAGRSVIVAGSTVVLAVMGLFLVGVQYMRGVALSTSLSVLVVMFTAITLLPALLAMLGPRVNKWKLPGVASAHERRERENDPDHLPIAARWSRQVQARPWPLAIITTLILIALSIPALNMNLGFPDASNNSPDDITYKAYTMIEEGFGAGTNGPFIVALDLSKGSDEGALSQVTSDLKGTDGVVAVTKPVISDSGNAAIITVIPEGSPQAPETEALANNIRDNVLPAAVAGTSVTALLGGQTPSYIDQSTFLADRLPVFISGVVLLSLLILLLAFRAPLIAIKAGIMNLLSVGAAYGVITLAAEGGTFGGLFGIDEAVPVAPFVPVIMFSILFGLSMDYEVFLMSRVREEYLKGAETHDAVTIGLARTARVITAAAAIMIAVFMSFVFSGLVFLKLMGIGMAAAVLLDATLVRMILVPAVLQILGNANWWIPNWMDKILPHWDLEPTDLKPAAEQT